MSTFNLVDSNHQTKLSPFKSKKDFAPKSEHTKLWGAIFDRNNDGVADRFQKKQGGHRDINIFKDLKDDLGQVRSNMAENRSERIDAREERREIRHEKIADKKAERAEKKEERKTQRAEKKEERKHHGKKLVFETKKPDLWFPLGLLSLALVPLSPVAASITISLSFTYFIMIGIFEKYPKIPIPKLVNK